VHDSSERGPIPALQRIGLWFASVLLAASFFSLCLSLFFMGLRAFFWVLYATTIAALPVWCLCVPAVIAIKNAEGRRVWTVLLGGSLIGPVLIALWCMIQQLLGRDPRTIWHGDPLLGVGGGLGIIFALIVGVLTASFYLISLRVLHRRSIASGARLA
jgi:hypothetical protein